MSLPVPKGPRQNWTMDFITDLPPSIRRGQVYDSILVTIDRYTKFSRYIPARKDWEAENMSDVLVEEIFTKFGMPVSIVTERSLHSVSWDDTYVNRGPMWRGEVELHPVGGKSGD